MTNIFNRILSTSQIEDAVVNTLQKWYPTYLAEMERQLGILPHKLPAPKTAHYTNRNTFEDLGVEGIPKIVVISPGLTASPTIAGDKRYGASWRVGVGIATGAEDEQISNMMVKGYAAATRALILQHQSLDKSIPGITNIRWENEIYGDLPISNHLQLYKSASVWFIVDVDNVVRKYGGPDEPVLPGPIDWPEAETVDVTIIKEDINAAFG